MRTNILKLKIKKHAPGVLFCASLASGAAALYSCVKETRKAEPVFAENKQLISDAKESGSKKNVVKAYVVSGVNVAKAYPATIGFATLGVGTSLVSHSYKNKQLNTALTAANAMAVTNQRIMKEVKAKYGDEAVQEIQKAVIIAEDKVAETAVGEDTLALAGEHLNPNRGFSFFFEEMTQPTENHQSHENCEFTGQLEYDLDHIIRVDAELTKVIQRKGGVVTLNEYRQMFGQEPTPDGQIWGWYYEPDGPNIIHSGYVTAEDWKKLQDMTGDGDPILLCPNVMGEVLSKL